MQVNFQDLVAGDIIEFVHAVSPTKATRAMVDTIHVDKVLVVIPGNVSFLLAPSNVLHIERVGNFNEI